MSSSRNITITCPRCKQEGSYTVYDSIDVEHNPELKEKVMDGTIFKWVCPKCGKRYDVPYSFLYKDKKHDFNISYKPDKSTFLMFWEYIRLMENGLDKDAVFVLGASHLKSHPNEVILFDSLSDDHQQLAFKIYRKEDNRWQLADSKHVIPYAEYEKTIDALRKEKKKRK